MHFLLLGATGRTGKHVLSELLSQGHTAVALIRTAGSLTPQAGLTVITGSPLQKDDIKRALSATPQQPFSGAIFTLNAPRKTESPFAAPAVPPRFLADSCANACEALTDAGVKRIVVMSTAGAGDSWGPLPWVNKAFMSWTQVKHALDDHNLLDAEIRKTNMDWTLVRPVKLEFDDAKKPADAKKEVEELDGPGNGLKMTDSVTVVSVAKFLVKVATNGLYVKDTVTVRN